MVGSNQALQGMLHAASTPSLAYKASRQPAMPDKHFALQAHATLPVMHCRHQHSPAVQAHAFFPSDASNALRRHQRSPACWHGPGGR